MLCIFLYVPVRFHGIVTGMGFGVWSLGIWGSRGWGSRLTLRSPISCRGRVERESKRARDKEGEGRGRLFLNLVSAFHKPLSSEVATKKIVKAKCWP